VIRRAEQGAHQNHQPENDSFEPVAVERGERAIDGTGHFQPEIAFTSSAERV
jgi:hypothetical protein